MLYCIIVNREMEDTCVLHHSFASAPSREEVLNVIMDEDIGYDDDCGKFEYFEVKI